MVTESRASERLPSLPQVLLRILDAIHSERADLQHIASIIHQDTAMTARLLSVANSSYYGRSKICQTVERALLFLGTDTVKTIVITASIKQFFNRFQPNHQPFIKAFWRRSLVSANFAHILANLTGYAAPDEAYLAGLMMDVGQLILLNQNDRAYLECWSNAGDDRALLALEREQFNKGHDETGADLVDSWQLSGFMGDAIRYHHEPGSHILDAHHLVKIINLASLLSAPGAVSDEAINQADRLFGLTEALTRELLTRISADVERIAGGLNIDIGINPDDASAQAAHAELGDRLGQLSQLGQMNNELWRSKSRSALEQAIQRIVYMTLGIERCVLFTVAGKGDVLAGYIAESLPENNGGKINADPDFIVPLLPERSLISNALLARNPTHSNAVDAAALSVLDRQLLKYCQASSLLCLPLVAEQEPIGVLVLGLTTDSENPQTSKPILLAALCGEIAEAIRHQSQRLAVATENGDGGDMLQEKIREAVHEAGNPLSIIRNYLEMLRIKLGESHQAHDDLNLIKEEIDRVGAILLRLREPTAAASSTSTLSLNSILSNLARIFEQSLCATHQISLKLQLADSMPPLHSSITHLQQILTNLIKNSIEALPPGGSITLGTESGTIVDGRSFASITIEDNGPGIPEAVMRRLFSPVSSSKGAGHSGLGLSITKKLIDEIGGSILCKSNKFGTRFQLLIPVT
ncbi:MAG TPA: HDOD domain-containing protein [Spongiibacteraceae bacterium]|nr:HDOD domain-containing protein [Spongiibacteraceae bacterium]